MSRVALLTPSPRDEAYRSRWPEVLELTAAPLRAHGLAVESRPWSEAGDLRAFDLVLPLLVWGYHREEPLWLQSLAHWETAGVRLANPASVLRWNSEKSYLGRLGDAGAPTVPTLYVGEISEAVLADAARSFGTASVVAKPIASSGAWRTIRWPADPVEQGPEGAAMVQPYLESIETEGEVSLLFFAGRFSHAIRKRPQPGDYRVQPEHRGIISADQPAADELEGARAVLAAAGDGLLYARVDLVRGRTGRPELIEIELIEPDLYLGFDPAEGAAFAEAVRSAAG